MNLKTAAEILALNTAAQREYAKEIGVKRAASDTKATLAAKLLDRTLEIEKEQAPKKATRPAKTSGKICNVCKTRRAGNDAGLSDMCQPCADEGGWENAHGDNDHAGITAKLAAGEELDDVEKTEASIWMPKCWICHPELNKAQRAPRTRESKAGMTVLAKGDKIGFVVDELRKLGAIVATETSKQGYTGLVARVDTAVGSYQIECGWWGRSFHYPAASINGKKFRNVSELFRMLGLS